MRAPQPLRRRRRCGDTVLDAHHHIGIAHEPALQLQHRQRKARQQVVLALAGEVLLQQPQPRRDRLRAAVDGVRRFGVDAEHAVERRFQDRRLGLAGVGDPSHLAQRLRDASQREYAFVHHAALPASVPCRRRSMAASVVAITAPPRHASPTYSTRDCPGVTARCGRWKRTCRVP